MVHALDLLGCVAIGPTTEEALAATPGAIRTYRRFLHRHGEPVDPDAPFETQNALSLQPAGGFALKSERALYILIHCYSAHFMLP